MPGLWKQSEGMPRGTRQPIGQAFRFVNEVTLVAFRAHCYQPGVTLGSAELREDHSEPWR